MTFVACNECGGRARVQSGSSASTGGGCGWENETGVAMILSSCVCESWSRRHMDAVGLATALAGEVAEASGLVCSFHPTIVVLGKAYQSSVGGT